MSTEFRPPQTHVLPLTVIRRARSLPWPGEVLLGTGNSVEPSDVVARAGKPRPHLILDVSSKLDVSVNEVQECCLKRPGEPVQQGEPIAIRKGLFGGRKITSPVEGVVLTIEAGRMIIQPRPEMFELRALLSGMVTSLSPGVGVTIETTGALIQGVWGSGKEGYGVLKMGVEEPGAMMTGEQIEIPHHGTVLVCGASLDMELLEKAQEVQARGIIVGAVPTNLQEAVSRQLLPVIATEGMGHIPMSSTIFKLLQANEGREAMMLAVTPKRWQPARPEIVIPLPASAVPEAPPKPGVVLGPGQKVRIRRAPYWGQVGTVQSVHTEPLPVEGGIKYPGAKVTLEDGMNVFVPHVNLDLVG
jgi:transcription antitermination factor NusG